MFNYPKKSIYSIRKIKSLTASVVIASTFLGGQVVLANEIASPATDVTTPSAGSETPTDEKPTADVTPTNEQAVSPTAVESKVEAPEEKAVASESEVKEDPILELNKVNNPSFDKDDYVSSSPTTIKHFGNDKNDYFDSISGDTVAKTKDNTTNDYILFEVNTEKGKTYTVTGDVYISVTDGKQATGAFFDAKDIAADGTQTTLAGGKSVADMADSVKKWSNQTFTFTAISDKTSIGLIKWNENPADDNTLNTTIYLNNLKVTENTEYKTVWEDNFNGSTLNQDKWGYELGNIRGNEQEHYSSSKENVFLKDGNLVLKVTDRPEKDQYRNTQRLGNNARLVKYNSGSVRTHGKQEFLYGRIEAKMKLPKGKGAFPAFWTLGADFPIDGRIGGKQGYGWPSTGEIDIMELIGSPTKERAAEGEVEHAGNSNRISYGTPHFYYADSSDGDKDGTYAPSRVGGNLTIPEDFYDQYHVFGINWTKDKLEWYVDGVVFRSVEFDKLEEGRRDAARLAFNRPQYIQFNLATGGNWAGDVGDNLAKDGTEFKIDWVRWLQSDEQKAQMDEYYKTQPNLDGVKDITMTEGEVADLLNGVSTDSPNHKVDYSIDNEYMFINSGAEGGRNEVQNVVANSAAKEKLAQLKPGVYNLYYSTVPTQADFSVSSAPVYRITRRSALLTVLPKALQGKVGDTVSTIVLPAGFMWENPNQIISGAGTYKAVFTNPNDTLTKVENRRQLTVPVEIAILAPEQSDPSTMETNKSPMMNVPTTSTKVEMPQSSQEVTPQRYSRMERLHGRNSLPETGEKENNLLLGGAVLMTLASFLFKFVKTDE